MNRSKLVPHGVGLRHTRRHGTRAGPAAVTELLVDTKTVPVRKVLVTVRQIGTREQRNQGERKMGRESESIRWIVANSCHAESDRVAQDDRGSELVSQLLPSYSLTWKGVSDHEALGLRYTKRSGTGAGSAAVTELLVETKTVPVRKALDTVRQVGTGERAKDWSRNVAQAHNRCLCLIR